MKEKPVPLNRIDIYHPDITLATLDGFLKNVSNSFNEDKP